MPTPTTQRQRFANTAARSRGLANLRALCELGLAPELLVPALLEALHEVVPSSRNLFDWTDANGELLRYFVEGPVDEEVARHYFEEFHNRREAEAMPLFRALRHAPAGVRSARELDHAGFFASALYNEIWRPQRLHWRVEAVLRGASGTLLGSLVLYRAPGERCFSSEEERLLASLLPMMAAALERGAQAPGPTQFVDRPGSEQSLLLTADGRISHASPGARQLLMLAQGGISRQALDAPLAELVGHALPVLQHALRRQPGGQPVLTQENPWGRFTLRAQALAGTAPASLTLVTLHWSEPHALALERALNALPLTPGQRGVCRRLLQGQTQSHIATQLGVSPATVVDHVRKIYLTLDLRSTQQLQARVDAEMRAAAPPWQRTGS